MATRLKQPYHGNLNLGGSFFRAAVVGFVSNPDAFNIGGGSPDLSKEDAERVTKAIVDGLCEAVVDKDGVLSGDCNDLLPLLSPVKPSEFEEMKCSNPKHDVRIPVFAGFASVPQKCVSHYSETPTTTPSAPKRSWTSAVSNVQCDTGAGEVFLGSSPGKVSSLDLCKQSCADSGDCQSITYFNSGYCSHFSTLCTKTKRKRKAVVLHYVEASAVTRSPSHWVDLGSKAVCDTTAGEVFLRTSSGKTSSFAQCKSSCEANLNCNSIAYFTSGYCSHFSTSCTKTMKLNKALMASRLVKS